MVYIVMVICMAKNDEISRKLERKQEFYYKNVFFALISSSIIEKYNYCNPFAEAECEG